METLKSITLSPSNIQKRFKVVNVEALTQYEKKIALYLFCAVISPIGMDGFFRLQFEKLYPYLIYSPLKNTHFNRFLSRIRKKYRIILLPRKETASTIHQNESIGQAGVYGFAMDQTPKLKSKSYWREFLGIRVPVFTGAERLAKKYNIPLVYASINRLKRGFYEVKFEVLEENSKKHL